jgi:hypothetical protein
LTLLLHKEFPDLKFVVQDLEKQIAAGEAVCCGLSQFYTVFTIFQWWKEQAPEAIATGRVQLQGQSQIFSGQLIT